MRFFKLSLSFLIFFALVFASKANESDLMGTIVSKERSNCSTNNLSFTAMKFYKIPLNETYEGREVFLRLLFFFNSNGSFTSRVTRQSLISCTNNLCSYHQVSDSYSRSQFEITNEHNLVIPDVGFIHFTNPENSNRGFSLIFNSTYTIESLRDQSFIGGMVSVNFNQQVTNTTKLCSQ